MRNYIQILPQFRGILKPKPKPPNVRHIKQSSERICTELPSS